MVCCPPSPPLSPASLISFVFSPLQRKKERIAADLSLSHTNSARIPQIIKNYREKSCEGLALLFFLLSLTGNFTYGASVMAYSQERDYFLRALPWLLGSLGTMVEDFIIFFQFRLYSPERRLKNSSSAVVAA